MLLRPYRDVLTTPGAAASEGLSLLARLPAGMTALLLVVLLERRTGTFAAGALVTAAVAVGAGASSPLRGRALDRHGARSLVGLSVANAGVTLALALLAAPGRLPLLAVLGLLQGASTPQVAAAMRLEWRRMLGTGTPRLATAYALEMSAHIATFVAGPLLATAGIALLGPRTTLLVAAAVTAAAGWAFARRTALRPLEPVHRARGLGSLRLPAVRSLVLVTALADLGMGIVDVTAIAAAAERGRPGLAGVLLAAFTVGSVLGGLLHGARTWTADPASRLAVILALFSAALVLLALRVPVGVLAVLLLLAGMPSAAQWSTTTLVLDAVTPDAGSEPFTWLSSANAAGIALGGVVAGLVVDAHGVAPAFLAAAAAAAAALLVTLVRRRTLTGSSAAGRAGAPRGGL